MKKVLLVTAALVLSSQSHADGGHGDRKCRLADFNGDWVAYQGTALANQPHTGVCQIHVQNGTATGDCDFSTGFTGPFAPSLEGNPNVQVNDDCSVELQMDFAPAPFTSYFHLQLHRDRESFVGRWDNNFGAVGVSNGVKL